MKNNKVALYYGLMIVLLILIGVSSFFFNYFYDMRNEDLSIEKMQISESNYMGYNVKLFDNDFFKTKEDETNYVLSLIDNINTYFNINTTFSLPVEGEYSFFVRGYIIMKQGDEVVKNEIYTGDINKFLLDGSVINLSNSFDIDLDSVIKSYKEQTQILDIDVVSNIQYDVTYNYSVFSENLGKSLVNSKTLTVSIPVNDITNITVTEDKEEKRDEFSELDYDDNKIYLIICLEFLGSIIIFILLIVLIVKRVNGQVGVYQDKLDSLKKKYEKYLVYLKELPDLSNHKVLFVQSMEDLVKTSDKTKIPISYIEVVEKCESTFMIINDNTAYVYKLSRKNA
ncbi:MAG: hypothetical protein J1F35_04900 [Erysipelotrichales bacterium]|nr:hypothetical protein [Erysipelotrichales bacterium]